MTSRADDSGFPPIICAAASLPNTEMLCLIPVNLQNFQVPVSLSSYFNHSIYQIKVQGRGPEEKLTYFLWLVWAASQLCCMSFIHLNACCSHRHVVDIHGSTSGETHFWDLLLHKNPFAGFGLNSVMQQRSWKKEILMVLTNVPCWIHRTDAPSSVLSLLSSPCASSASCRPVLCKTPCASAPSSAAQTRVLSVRSEMSKTFLLISLSVCFVCAHCAALEVQRGFFH